MIEYIKSKLLRYVVRVVVPENVVHDVKGVLYLGKEKVTMQELRSIQAEIKALDNMRIWSIINESIKQLCYERGWRDSSMIVHLNTAKTMYNVLETQVSIIEKFRNVK